MVVDPGDAAEPDPALERRISAARPDGDTLIRSVRRSRVAAALFGDAEPVAVGRYRLQRQLGRGGGGSVFVATDPELARDVAVKLIRCTSERHRERALAEGRALAKLSHPNVVPVHDVGATADHVYLVMELLRGESLREFAAGVRGVRGVRELVAAYRQAASGLAAAHAVGLVHRDFKPDNAMFGDDGRLRVVDFGLAADAGEAAAVGTPGYMAPEQRAGAPSDAAADQYALGVALREAVGAPPAWLGRVLARATAERPGDRYPSMAALADGLADDPRSRWRRRALIAAPIAIAIAGFGIGRRATSPAAEACAGGPEALAPAWTPAHVDRIDAHVRRLGTPFAAATAPLVRERLGKLGEAWLAAHRQSCAAHARGELSDELYDRATVCLARSRIALGEAIGVLGAVTADQLDEALAVLPVIDRAERCADPAALAAEASPQPTPAMRELDQQIEAAAFHARAATSRAIPLARHAASAARTTGDRRLLARALLVLGHAQMAADLGGAIAPLDEAMLLGIEEGLDDVAAEAYARRAFALAQDRPAERARSLEGVALARAIGRRAGERGAFARALLSNNAGAVAMLGGDLASARAGFRRAVDEAREVTGPGAVELLTALSNLALLTPDDSERRRLLAAAVAGGTAAVGPEHPQTFDKRLRAIADGKDARVVVTELTALCRRLATLHPTLDELVAVCALELAWQATALDLPALVREATHPPRPGAGVPAWLRSLLAAYAALADGAATPSLVAELSRLTAAQIAEIPHSWYQNLIAADAGLALAAAARASGDAALAARAADQAAQHLEAYVAITGVSAGSIERRLRWARELRLDH